MYSLSIDPSLLFNFIYLIAFIPQIFFNWKKKSVKGLSSTMIIISVFWYLAQVYNIFLLGLPIGYKIFIPLVFLAFIILLVQKFYYHRSNLKHVTLFLFALIGVNLAMLISLCYFKLIFVTNFITWIILVLGIICQIPQIFKNFQKKSAKGLSFSFIALMVFGISLETLFSIYLKLPAPLVLSSFRALFMNALLGFQIYLYQ